MRNSIVDWVRNLQHLVMANMTNVKNNEIQLKIIRVNEINETLELIQMTTDEFNHLSMTAQMLQKLMVGWEITVYPIDRNESIIYAHRKERFY